MRRILIKRDISQMTIWVDKTLHDWLKAHSKTNKTSMSQIVQEQIIALKASVKNTRDDSEGGG